MTYDNPYETVYVLELAGDHDEFAAFEAQTKASAVSMLAPGLASARGITEEFTQLAFAHRASELLGRTRPSIANARTLLEAANFDRTGTVAVRAVDVRGTTGIDTQTVERELGDVLVARGFGVDLDNPDHELRALFSAGKNTEVCALGWLVAETERGFDRRAPGERPFFQPGGMDAMLARALANMAGATPESRILDPMCGTGGLLLEAGLLGADVVGLDAQRKMVRGTRENLYAFLTGEWELIRGDAAALPLVDDTIDGVVFDTPYGRQSKITGELDELITGALSEARRVAPRCVLVGDRLWEPQATDAGWTVKAAFERRVHRSLTRHILVLTR